MLTGIDHLVIACADPDAAATELEATIGLASTGGGRHASGGTFNRIAWLADGSYLELIGVHDRSEAADTPLGRAVIEALEAGGGLATYALAADDLDATVDALRSGGSQIGDAVASARRRPDGELVRWAYAMPARPMSPSSVPFLIQHVYEGAEWGPDAMGERSRFVHPIGSPVVVTRLDLAVAEPLVLAADLHTHAGLDMRAVADLAVAEIGRHVLRLVPRAEMPVPAVVTLGARIETPLTADLLGMRFDVEPGRYMR